MRVKKRDFSKAPGVTGATLTGGIGFQCIRLKVKIRKSYRPDDKLANHYFKFLNVRALNTYLDNLNFFNIGHLEIHKNFLQFWHGYCLPLPMLDQPYLKWRINLCL